MNLKYVTHTETTDAPSPDSLYKVGRDASGNKARACIYIEYCHLSPRWYCKKCDMESHLRKEHGIDIVQPRVSTDVGEALNPSEGGVSTLPRRRRQKMSVRQKEVESNTDDVLIHIW